MVVTILSTKGAQNIHLIPALYAPLNPDDGSDHPKSNLLGRDWQVMPGDSFSDHRQIQFVIKQDKRPSNRRRNTKNTNWNTYQEESKVGLWFGNITTPADIDRELSSRQL